MLMVVTPTPEETENLRRTYAKLHTFVYCATYDNFVSSAEKYKPDAVLLVVHSITDVLIRKLEKVKELLPVVALITLSDMDTSPLSPNLKYSLRVQKLTLKFQAHYFAKASQKVSSVSDGALIVSGLLMLPFAERVLLFGRTASFTPEEVFLLRFLAEKHPVRVSAEELGHHCFTYGKPTPRSTVAARISRINKLAEKEIFTPIITYRRGEGYGLDF